MNLINHGKQLSEQEITELETVLHVRFPDDYRNFLIAHNASTPKDSYLVIESQLLEEEVLIAVFLGKAANLEFDLVTWNRDYAEDLPEDTFIFGLEESDGMFILITRGEDKGVYYWDSTYSFENSSDNGNTYFIAENFSDFLGLIVREDMA